MSKNRKTILATAGILIVALGASGVVIYKNSQVEPLTTRAMLESSSNGVPGVSDTQAEQIDDIEFSLPILPSTLEIDGVKYELKDSVTTFLLLGVDRNAGEGNGYASHIFLFALDSEEKTINVIKVPSYWESVISVYDDSRNLSDVLTAPIGTQYSYGDSDSMSCTITKPVVINALSGCPVDYYFSITNHGLVDVVDSLDSVDVVLRNDWTDLDPSYDVDATVTLNADDVQAFFDIIPADGEEMALNRGDWFILSLFRSIMSASSSDVDSLMNAAEGSYATDVSADMIDQFRGYEMRGSIVASQDRSAFEKQIANIFYKEV